MIIYLDFDGTVVEHNYPLIGAENPHSIRIIKALQEKGHQIILNTYRADLNDGSLQDALDFLNQTHFELIPILTHTTRKIHPGPFDLAESIRFEKLYIDDIAENIPLIPNRTLAHGEMVDWITLEMLLRNNQIL